MRKIVATKETSNVIINLYKRFLKLLFLLFLAINISQPGTALASSKFLSHGSSYPWLRRLKCLRADLCVLLLAKVFLNLHGSKLLFGTFQLLFMAMSAHFVWSGNVLCACMLVRGYKTVLLKDDNQRGGVTCSSLACFPRPSAFSPRFGGRSVTASRSTYSSLSEGSRPRQRGPALVRPRVFFVSLIYSLERLLSFRLRIVVSYF